MAKGPTSTGVNSTPESLRPVTSQSFGVEVSLILGIPGSLLPAGQAICADQPPSTVMIAPVTNEARSEARKAATSATSTGCPAR